MKNGLKRIIVHWTAGGPTASANEKRCYHYLVESSGKIVKGTYIPEDNSNCNDGKYAAHTGGGNTGSIGISLCGMAGYKENVPQSARYPLSAIQCEAAWKKIAELCKAYNIQVTPDTVMTHYEFGLKHPTTTSAHKIDIMYLPHEPKLKPQQIGDYIRTKVKWYLGKL